MFSAPEHQALDEHFRVDAKTVDFRQARSIPHRTGESIVTVTAAGEVSVRGKNVTTRASNLNRIRGGGSRSTAATFMGNAINLTPYAVGELAGKDAEGFPQYVAVVKAT